MLGQAPNQNGTKEQRGKSEQQERTREERSKTRTQDARAKEQQQKGPQEPDRTSKRSTTRTMQPSRQHRATEQKPDPATDGGSHPLPTATRTGRRSALRITHTL